MPAMVHETETDHQEFTHSRGSEPLPGYKLLEPLRRGGFGEVWKCEAPGGLHKAIKFVQGGGLHPLEQTDRAGEELRGIQCVKSIRHPFVLTIERVEIVNGELLVILELADRSLADVLQGEKEAGRIGIPRKKLLGYLREAAEALDVMNVQHGLQHLDVKPHNLFLVSNHVKVGDFGLVQSLMADGSSRTGNTWLSGFTPLYSAPEIFSGVISQHADQYSLAIVYLELLTGSPPHSGKNARQLMLKHLQTEPDLGRAPESDRVILARALSKDPDHRFPSCSDFIHALISGQTELVSAASTQRILKTVGGRTTLAGSCESILPAAIEATSPSASEARLRASEMLHYRFSSSLPADVVRLRLDSFQHHWKARTTLADSESLALHMDAPRSFWQRLTSHQPRLEVRLRVVPLTNLSPEGLKDSALVLVDLLPLECSRNQSGELLRVVGPLLAESVRTHLQGKQQYRSEERLVWRHPLQVCAVQPDGSVGPAVDCQGKDISLNGIGFYLPGDVPDSPIMLFLPQTELTTQTTLVARIVRVQGCGDGWHEVGAVLDSPREIPQEDDREVEEEPNEESVDLADPAAPLPAEESEAPPPEPESPTPDVETVARRLSRSLRHARTLSLTAAILLGIAAGIGSRHLGRTVQSPDPAPPAPDSAVAAAPASGEEHAGPVATVLPKPEKEPPRRGGSVVSSPEKGPTERGSPTRADIEPERPQRDGVVVESNEKEYKDLQSAIDDAPDGGVLLVKGNLRCRPMRVTGKALTIRGVKGAEAVLKRLASPETRWEPLVWSNRPLVIEGVELRGGSEDLVPLVCVEEASLTLRNCKIATPSIAPALALRQGAELRMTGCELAAENQALAVQIAGRPCRIALRNCRVAVRAPAGAMLLLWSSEPQASAAVDVELSDSHCEAGRVLVCRSVTGPVHVATSGNKLAARETRVSFSGYRDPAAARQVVSWSERSPDQASRAP